MAKSHLLSTQSQLLMRNAEYFESGRWALVNATEADIFNQLNNPHIDGLHQYYSEYASCKQSTANKHIFGASFSINSNDDAYDGVVIYMPKSKQQLSMLIDNMSALVKANAVILVVGENRAGIKSVSKLLDKVGSPVNKLDSAKHCGLYAVTVNNPSTSFDIQQYTLVKSYQVQNQTIRICSLPGVFGHKQLDAGTELLLNQLGNITLTAKKPHIYDFACGTGVIGCYLAKLFANDNVSFSMSDNSALAIYCSKQSAELNGLDIYVVAADGLAQLTNKVDLIVTNPPFHSGIKNDYSITQKFIKNAFSHSNQYASIILVANKFLPYPDMLETAYGGFSELASTNQYKVYHAKKTQK